MLKNYLRLKVSKAVLKIIPETSGVYIFFDDKGIAHYIGKAKNLRNRLRSYLSLPLSGKTKQMIESSSELTYIKVNSELEALLLEAKLVRKYMPKYNIQLKDDKNPLYIKITNDVYPIVTTARKIDDGEKNIAFFGPFPSSTNVKYILKLLRKIIPYSTHKPSKRICLYRQIGLCNPCPSEIENNNSDEVKLELRSKYLRQIKLIKKILSGKLEVFYKDLKNKMEKASNNQNFELALELRNILQKFDYITQTINYPSEYIKNPNLLFDIRANELQKLRDILSTKISLPYLHRIECYDVAHLHGSQPTASMVVFINGEADKSLYRRFKIANPKSQDDISSISEVAKRRGNHLADWGEPDLIIVDGGQNQVKAFKKEYLGKKDYIIGLAKRFETLIFSDQTGKYLEYRIPQGPALNLVQRLRNEAHRFARVYHHMLVEKSLLEN
jgi:excinuclease ABC subunit C